MINKQEDERVVKDNAVDAFCELIKKSFDGHILSNNEYNWMENIWNIHLSRYDRLQSLKSAVVEMKQKRDAEKKLTELTEIAQDQDMGYENDNK